LVIEFEEVYEVKCATTGLPFDKHHSIKEFASRNIYINPEYVVCVRDDPKISTLIKESNSSIRSENFTRVYMHRGQTGIDVIVSGDPTMVEQKLRGGKELLKG